MSSFRYIYWRKCEKNEKNSLIVALAHFFRNCKCGSFGSTLNGRNNITKIQTSSFAILGLFVSISPGLFVHGFYWTFLNKPRLMTSFLRIPKGNPRFSDSATFFLKGTRYIAAKNGFPFFPLKRYMNIVADKITIFSSLHCISRKISHKQIWKDR